MSDQLNVLIICRHNSGRSQIAEAYLKKRTGGRVQVDSAGLEPAAAVNSLVVEVMKEEGFDLSPKSLKASLSFSNRRAFDTSLP